MTYTIFTNNPVLAEFIKQQPEMESHEVKLMSTPAMDVLLAVKSAIRQGAATVSNPMAGVRMTPPRLVKPQSREKPAGPIGIEKPATGKPVAVNPYVSIAVTTKQEAVDFKSIKAVDEAIELYRKNARLRFIGHSDEAIKSFQIADMEMLASVLSAL